VAPRSPRSNLPAGSPDAAKAAFPRVTAGSRLSRRDIFSGLVKIGNIADFGYASELICTNRSCINPFKTAAMSFLCIFANF
jgi:hypothetical protein